MAAALLPPLLPEAALPRQVRNQIAELAAASAVSAVSMNVDIEEGMVVADDAGSPEIPMDVSATDEAVPASATVCGSKRLGNGIRGWNRDTHPHSSSALLRPRF